VNELLSRYETFEPSLAVIAKYLEQARRALNFLPESGGRAGLFGLADFLAQQTGTLAVSI
jgi:geranylgeranyl pyrophosphate synthase